MIDHTISRRAFLFAAAVAGIDVAVGGISARAGQKVRSANRNIPVAVIGAGLGGLSTAALLARQGFPVSVFEQHDIPGGYATTFDRAQGRFTFDVSLHRTSVSPETLALFDAMGVRGKVDFVDMPNAARVIGPTTDERIDFAPEASRKRLMARFPKEAVGIQGYFNYVKGVMAELDALRANSRPGDFPNQYPKLWHIRDKSLTDFLGDYVKTEEVKKSLSAGWGAYGTPPSRLSAFYYIVASYSTQTRPQYIKPRSQALSTAIADAITEAGGRIHYETAVTGVRVKDGLAAGVTLDDGSVHPAKIVVSNASAVATLNRMLPPGALPKDYLARVDGYRPSLSTFIIWLGLNQDITKSVPDCRIVLESGDSAEADYLASIDGKVEQLPLSLIIYDHVYKGYSQPGTSTMTIITNSGYGPWQRFEADYKAGNKTAYRKEKERWTRQLIQRVEQAAIPGLTAMAEVVEAATPLTHWRYTGNPEGAVNGYEQSVDNAFMERIKNQTPVKGLYLAGAWSDPGGGYNGALKSGQRTAAHILKTVSQIR